MSKVTISKKEYKELKEQSKAYKKIATKLFSAVVKSSVEDVVVDFKNTGLYSKEFILDLQKGLEKSSYSR